MPTDWRVFEYKAKWEMEDIWNEHLCPICGADINNTALIPVNAVNNNGGWGQRVYMWKRIIVPKLERHCQCFECQWCGEEFIVDYMSRKIYQLK
jgi:predicted RNA-binding Zn-ribbon protein involved in translation (DUF1610 family)